MDLVYKILLILHIACAALLFGGGIGMVRNLKRCLQAGKAAFLPATEDAAKRGKIMGLASFATLLTGLALIFTVGGFKAIPVTIHIALTLMLVAIGVSSALIRPHTMKLVKYVAAENLDSAAIEKSIKKIAMGTGILHLIWITILVLMIAK